MDRKVFYDGVRHGPFPGKFTQDQVDGMNVILDEWDKRKLTELSWLAYMLATTFHETATRMEPVIETRGANEAANPSVDEAIRRLDNAFAAGKLKWVKTPYWRKDANGQSWLGRGFVQLTHKTNYQNAEAKTGIPCATQPDLMLQAAPAASVMFGGMIGGWFTGKKLADFLGGGKTDFFNARTIINGHDRAQDIANYADKFFTVIKAASAPASA